MKQKSYILKDALPLDVILSNLDSVQRQVVRLLAEKPSPSVLHVHDVGVPTDYYADYVWISLFKEKSYKTCGEGISGILQPNTDIMFVPGFAVDGTKLQTNCVSDVLVHSHDLLVENIHTPAVEYSWLRTRMYYMPLTSSGMLIRAEFSNRGKSKENIKLFHMLFRAPKKPSNRFHRDYYHSYGSKTYTVFTSAGKLLKREYNDDKNIVFLVYNEHDPNKREPVGKLLCALASQQRSESSFFSRDAYRLDGKTKKPYYSGLIHDICINPNETKAIRFAIQFQRFGGSGENPYIPAISESAAKRSVVEKLSLLFSSNKINHVQKSLNAYRKYPAIDLPERKYEPAIMASLDLPRGSTYSPTGKMRNSFYNFCRINASESYEWWNYGQHAHESIPLINAAITNSRLAAEMLMNHFDMQKPDGKIPYGVRQTGMLDLTEATMPILGWLAWNIYLWSGDRKFLRKAYKACRKFHEWWMKNRTDGKSILCNWLSPHETVRDIKEMPVWNIMPVKELLAIDANSFILREEELLSKMAIELGEVNSQTKYRNIADERKRLMNWLMWDEKDGCYYGISRTTGQKVRIKDIAVLMPLYGGAPSGKRAKYIAKMIANPAEFGTPYPLPTLAVSDPFFGKNMAPPVCGKGPNVQGAAPCMGDNWPELTYLVVEGLELYGYHQLAAEIAYKNVKMVMDTLIETSHFREHYDSISGLGTGLYDYIWSSIASAFLIRFIFGIRPEAKGLRIRPELPGDWGSAGISNLHIRNAVVNLEVKSAKTIRSAIIGGRKMVLNADGSIFIPWKTIAKSVAIEYNCK